jgi:hypothetical protein
MITVLVLLPDLNGLEDSWLDRPEVLRTFWPIQLLSTNGNGVRLFISDTRFHLYETGMQS